MTTLHGHNGKSYKTGSLLAEGGEGQIFALTRYDDWVAKIYKDGHRTSAREEKLEAMIQSPPRDEMWESSRHPSISWPLELLRTRGGALAGYLMPRIRDSHSIINAYNPRAAKNFHFDWRDQYQVARNLCVALGALHAKNYVMGDVNERNILVNKIGLVSIVDTDSFQVRQGGVVHRCIVGVPEYTPPELQGVRFDEVDRSPEHDNFGLAILLFRLLMQGHHPFNASIADLTLSVGKVDEYCIRNGIFAWIEHSQFTKPPHAHELNVLAPALQSLFQKAFVSGHIRPSLRPSPKEWLAALRSAQSELVRCPIGHWHRRELDCPDCLRIPPRPARKVGLKIPPQQTVTARHPSAQPFGSKPPSNTQTSAVRPQNVAHVHSARGRFRKWSRRMARWIGVGGMAYLIFTKIIPDLGPRTQYLKPSSWRSQTSATVFSGPSSNAVPDGSTTSVSPKMYTPTDRTVDGAIKANQDAAEMEFIQRRYQEDYRSGGRSWANDDRSRQTQDPTRMLDSGSNMNTEREKGAGKLAQSRERPTSPVVQSSKKDGNEASDSKIQRARDGAAQFGITW